MNVNSSFCLPGLRDADDVPHPIANTPLWSENYLSYANFPEAGIFFWLHHGRTVYDPELWQEIFVAYLPGDRYLVSKATALSDTPMGPRAAGLTYRCVKPFEAWQKSFRGAARLLSGRIRLEQDDGRVGSGNESCDQGWQGHELHLRDR